MSSSVVTSQCIACSADVHGTRFCEACGAPVVAPSVTFGRARRPLFVVLAVTTVVLLVAGAALATSILVTEPTKPVAAPLTPDATPSPESTPSEAPTAPPSEPVPDSSARPALPASCETIYSASMIAQLQSYGVVVNPAWSTEDPGAGLRYQSAELNELLSTLPNLRCFWGSPLGGSGIGLETRLAPVTPDEAAIVQSRLATLGYSAIEELGGTRYVFEVSASQETANFGESHIVVGGYWFATSWLELGVTGYTADMVTTLVR